MNNSLETSTESFVDPHEEIFIGPITDREREIRKNLPRRTLHPSEVEELTQRGMSYKEWEEYKEQCNSEAIKQVYDEEDESSTDSFSSCNSDDEGKSQDGSLNDTWEIQERMLAMAERLERGEDIPELGICHNGAKDESVDMDGIFPLEDTKSPEISNCEINCEIPENVCDGQKNETVEAVLAAQALSEGAKQVSEAIDEQETLKSTLEDSKERDLAKSSDVEIVLPQSDLDLIDLHAINVEEIVQNSISIEKGNDILLPNSCIVDKFLMKTPTKTPRTGLPTSSNAGNSFKTPIGTPLSSATKKRTPLTASALKKPTPSPVGMYIRGGPEPMLIENVRLTQKKLPYTNPAITRQKIAVKNAQGRWSIDVKRSSTDNDCRAKENGSEIDSNIKPVLPVVLHEAVASMVTENSSKETSTMPWSRGKIGKLLERNPSPTVLKHQGRIQVNKSEMVQTTKIPNGTLKSGKKLNHRDSSMMDVSVLQEVVSSIQLPTSQKSGIPVRRAYNFLK